MAEVSFEELCRFIVCVIWDISDKLLDISTKSKIDASSTKPKAISISSDQANACRPSLQQFHWARKSARFYIERFISLYKADNPYNYSQNYKFGL